MNSDKQAIESGTPFEVFRVFLKLGLTCFGGPIAHIGYFREEFVVRRRWIDDPAFGELVALCQFLPGPASSQVGFSIGLLRAGYRGAMAAWVGFTMPSAMALVLFAYGAARVTGPVATGLLHGLSLVAVAIVAQAVWGMSRALCPDRERASIAIIAAVIVLLVSTSTAQLLAIAVAAVAGRWLCRGAPVADVGRWAMPVSRTMGLASLSTFAVLLLGLPALGTLLGSTVIARFDAFFRSGALVFGGGHVVLPLLHEALVVPGWVSEGAFVSGYGAAQAVPGPLFTFAAYLGAAMQPSSRGIEGAAIGLVGIFLPGLLILVGALPFWDALRRRRDAQAVMRGVNAAVVGLLCATLYDPVWTHSVETPVDVAIVLLGFALLTVWRMPPWFVVALSAFFGVAMAWAG